MNYISSEAVLLPSPGKKGGKRAENYLLGLLIEGASDWS
jgi:hypothetical protein